MALRMNGMYFNETSRLGIIAALAKAGVLRRDDEDSGTVTAPGTLPSKKKKKPLVKTKKPPNLAKGKKRKKKAKSVASLTAQITRDIAELERHEEEDRETSSFTPDEQAIAVNLGFGSVEDLRSSHAKASFGAHQAAKPDTGLEGMTLRQQRIFIAAAKARAGAT